MGRLIETLGIGRGALEGTTKSNLDVASLLCIGAQKVAPQRDIVDKVNEDPWELGYKLVTRQMRVLRKPRYKNWCPPLGLLLAALHACLKQNMFLSGR